MKRSYDTSNTQNAVVCKKATLVERNYQPSGVDIVNTNLMARRAPTDLVELAMEIQKADSFVHASASNKLQIIAQQVRFLQQQARSVLMETKQNLELHHTPCNFVKVPGSVYHLYKRPAGQTYFGMLSPQEWTNCPHTYIGSYRLEQDHSWTPIEDIQQKDDELALISKILQTNEQAGLLHHALQDVPMDV